MMLAANNRPPVFMARSSPIERIGDAVI